MLDHQGPQQGYENRQVLIGAEVELSLRKVAGIEPDVAGQCEG